MFKIFKKKNKEQVKLYSFDLTKEQVELIKFVSLFGYLTNNYDKVRHELYDMVKDIKFE